jgi:adenine-specific DNA methylase
MKASELATKLLELAKIEDLEVMSFDRDYRDDLTIHEIGDPYIIEHKEIVDRFKEDLQDVPGDAPNKFISI